jgi:hypothetical protein
MALGRAGHWARLHRAGRGVGSAGGRPDLERSRGLSARRARLRATIRPSREDPGSGSWREDKRIPYRSSYLAENERTLISVGRHRFRCGSCPRLVHSVKLPSRVVLIALTTEMKYMRKLIDLGVERRDEFGFLDTGRTPRIVEITELTNLLSAHHMRNIVDFPRCPGCGQVS